MVNDSTCLKESRGLNGLVHMCVEKSTGTWVSAVYFLLLSLKCGLHEGEDIVLKTLFLFIS